MKKIIRLFCLALCALLVIPFFAACNPEEQPHEPVTLTFSGSALASGTVGVSYSASVATAKGAEDISYSIVLGSSPLPGGLSLSDSGAITGTPSQAVSNRTVKIRATAADESIDPVDANFTITVDKGGISFTASDLPDATVGELYNKNIATASVSISGVTLKYEVKSTTPLPDGLELSAAGVISGYPAEGSEVEEYKFIVIASETGTAANFNAAEAEFTITVLEPVDPGYNPSDVLTFITGEILEVGTVREPYSVSIRADGTAPQNITYTYEFFGIGFPEGLDMNQFGVLSGTPLDSTVGVDEYDTEKKLEFIVKANAPGYDEIEKVFYLKVEDPLVETDRFHAILFDLEYTKGNGWSSNDEGLDMIRVDERGDLGGFLGYLHAPGQVLAFEIYSSAATTGNLSIRIASEMGAVEVTDEDYVIRVNGGEPCSYDEIITGDDDKSPQGSQNGPDDFITVEIGEIELEEGLNIITFEMMDNEFFCGERFGNFEFDWMQIDTVATLSWRPKTYNLIAKGLDEAYSEYWGL